MNLHKLVFEGLSMKKSIVVVGSINTDLIMQVDHLPAPGETILSEDIQTAGGGKGANQAVAAARLGGNVYLVGRVGNDVHADFHLQTFFHENINTQAINHCSAVPTGTAVILVDSHGQNSIVVSPGANAQVKISDVKNAKTFFKPDSILVLQLEIPLETVIFAVQQAKECKMQVILNPAPAQQLPTNILNNVDILILNETEMEIISGRILNDEYALLNSINYFLDEGVKTVILTLGAQGARYFSRQQQFFQPAFNVQAVDTTAAGDAFVGAFAIALSEDFSPTKSMQFASAAGALAATQLGAQPSLPTKAALNRFLEERGF